MVCLGHGRAMVPILARRREPKYPWQDQIKLICCQSAIGLMHDNVTRSNFTTKPRLSEIFSNLWHLRVVFTRVFFSSLLLWEFVHVKIFNLHFQSEAWWWNLLVWCHRAWGLLVVTMFEVLRKMPSNVTEGLRYLTCCVTFLAYTLNDRSSRQMSAREKKTN